MRFVRLILGSLSGVIVLLLLVLAGLSAFCFSGKYTVPILMYHHVSNDGSDPEYVTPENFRWQMEYLKKNHYQVIKLDDLVEKIESGQPLPRKSVVITFDDGYENNYTRAFPLLKEFQFPASFYICPDWVGTTDGKGKFMSWEQIREMKEAGFSFGSHSMTHAYLPDMSVDQLRYEIVESKRVLEKQLKTKIDYIAYPVGGFTDEVVALIKKTGYQAALTTNRGYDRFDHDLFELNRIRLSNADNRGIILAIKLSGFYNRFRDLKKPY